MFATLPTWTQALEQSEFTRTVGLNHFFRSHEPVTQISNGPQVFVSMMQDAKERWAS
jgi:hypothetical protein